MRKLFLAWSLASLLLCVGCGSSNGVKNFIPKGNFSNASLSGQYVYQISGVDFSNLVNVVQYREAGVFTADGKGNITSGTDDFSEGSGGVATNAVSGSYSLSNDGTGRITLNGAGGIGLTFAVTVVSPSKVYLIEGDTFLNAAGVAEKQDTTVLSSLPSGAFAFRTHTLSTGSVASVGAFTVTSGVVVGNEDVNRAGSTSSLTLSGSFNTPGALAPGRGTGTFTDSSPLTSSFIYYIVDANNVRFLSSDPGILGLGRAERQSGTLALSGSYAFGGKGDTSVIGGANTVGAFTASGGNITAGAFDSVQDGNTSTNLSITGGSYTPVSSAGRTTVTLNASTGTIHEIAWIVSPSRAFFLINDPSKVEDGTMDLQTVSSFSNSTMNGQFAFVMDGFDPNPKDRVGTLQWDGNGNLTLNEFANAFGLTNIVVLPGTYSVSSNGRTTGSVSNLSNNLVFYLISGTDAYVLQNDSGVEVSGTISKQP